MAGEQKLTSVRLEKALYGLKGKGFKLRSDIVICNKKSHMKTSDVVKLRTVGASDDYLAYPINTICMSFVREDPLSESLLTIWVGEDGKAYIGVSYEDAGNGVPVLSTDSRYIVCVGEDEPDEVGGERVDGYELYGCFPVLYKKLEEMDMLIDNMALWRVFGDMILVDKSEDVSKSSLCGLSTEYLDDLGYMLDISGFSEYNRSVSEGVEVFQYSNAEGSCFIDVSVGHSVSAVYSDIYSGSVIDEAAATSSLLDEYDTCGDISIPKGLTSSRYKSVMTNYEVSEATFKLSAMSLDDLLDMLHNDGYRIDSLGLVGVSNIVSSKTVCGFRSNRGYMYVVFYFSEDNGGFMVRVLSSSYKRAEIVQNGVPVPMLDLDVHDVTSATTLVRGFDFDNFREHKLV